MQEHRGFLGTVVTIGTGLFGFLAKHETELRTISFVISIAVGTLTLLWWLKRWIKWAVTTYRSLLHDFDK